MAQSSDSNDSNHNQDSGSSDAEQLLDTIIGHIDSADDSEKAEQRTSHEVPDSADGPDPVEGDGNRQKPGKADFKEIEERAAQLAERLGGAGLSFNAATKLLLEENSEAGEAEMESEPPQAVAVIHDEDVDMDRHSTDHSRVAGADIEDPDELKAAFTNEIVEQKLHINEWEADAREERGESPQENRDNRPDNTDNGSLLEEQELVGEQMLAEPASLVDDTPHAVEKVAEQDPLEPVPDLQDIEQQIESLSASMNESDTDVQTHQAEQTKAVVGDLPEEIETASLVDVNTRIASIETQMVRLLDKVTVSDRNVGEMVADIAREETQKAVHEAIASSDLIGELKAGLLAGDEDRRRQDTQISDSLDALHDALKDVGERMSDLERAKPEPLSDLLDSMPKKSGIASSVLGSRLSAVMEEVMPSEESVVAEEEEVLTPTEVEHTDIENIKVEDDLPTWLEDATQDLHGKEEAAPDEAADVFATTVRPKTNAVPDSIADDPVVEELAEEFPEEEIAQAGSDDALPAEQVNPIDEAVEIETVSPPGDADVVPDADDVAVDREILSASSPATEPEAEIQPEPEPEPVPELASRAKKVNEGSDFLHAARAAAIAANERARALELERARENEESQRLGFLKKSKFLSAAKEKQELPDLPEQEPQLAVEEPAPAPREPARNSLFSEKTEGPNFLLVFTSLILFGTSALLLYGMANNASDSGSIAKLNAVEQIEKAEKKAVIVPQEIVKKQIVARPKSRLKKKPKSKLKNRRRDKRSMLDAAPGHQEMAEREFSAARKKNEDTLTDYDRLVGARIAAQTPFASPVDITGAIPNPGIKNKAGSLFDEYVSFSGLSDGKNASKKSDKAMIGNKSSGALLNNMTDVLETAKKGNVEAQYEVARRYGNGVGVHKSAAISIQWYEKSAQAGYAPAIYRLATMYERGKGVSKNYTKAKTLYISAAEKGNMKAMHNLAVLYTGGNLGNTDYKNAIVWYEKAAQFGVKDSQFNLAIIYQNGMGGAQNLEKAYKWYKLAAQAGDTEAKALMQGLRDEFSPSELKQMDEELREWKAKAPDKSANATRQFSNRNGNIGPSGTARL